MRAVGVLLLLLFAACDTPRPRGDDPPDGPGEPPPIATDDFRAADGARFRVQTIVTHLQIPWALAFTPDGRLFVTERPGRVRIVQNGTLLTEPALTLPDVHREAEAGLLGIAVHPQFADNHFVYLVYTADAAGGPVNRLVRYREVGNTLAERAVLFDDIPAAGIHDGARLKFGPDGKLYMTMGDAADPSSAQDLGSLNGKIFRMNDDGSRPADNPYPSLVYSYGHRNPQGIDWQPGTGALWETEHGQTGNDEINRIVAGRNYGWPVIEGSQTMTGMDRPVAFFNPSIAPSGMAFATGTVIASFTNNVFVAALRGEHLLRVQFDPADPRRITTTERLVNGRYGRLRDVVSAPDGRLYFCTSNRDGRGAPVATDDRIFRIVPTP